jgi:hypothetical protein
MDFDFDSFYKRLQEEVRSSTDFGASLKSMLECCAKLQPHPAWAELMALDTSKEIKATKRWLPRVIKREPCPFPVRGAYFGLSEFAYRGAEYANMYVALMSAYDPNDQETQWLFEKPTHYPDKGHLNSKSLKAAGLLCAGEDSLGTPGLICYSMSFSALLLRHVLDAEMHQLLGGTGPIGVVTGYDSGDLLRLGEMTAEGFVPNKSDFV